MRILVDQVAPSDSVDKYQSEVVYDGHPDSDVFYVPPHWHKVSSATQLSFLGPEQQS